MKAGVYFLRDPVSGIVRYVGQTTNLNRRMYEHKTNFHSRLCLWIDEMRLQGLEPLVEFIRVSTKEGRDSVEKALVLRYSSTVFNGTSGGAGGFSFAEDVLVRKTNPKASFYRCRDSRISEIRRRLFKRGWKEWQLERSINGGIAWQMMRRGCIYALKAAKSRVINCGTEYDNKHLSDVYSGPSRASVFLNKKLDKRSAW